MESLLRASIEERRRYRLKGEGTRPLTAEHPIEQGGMRETFQLGGARPTLFVGPRLAIELSDEDVEAMYQEYLKREEKK